MIKKLKIKLIEEFFLETVAFAFVFFIVIYPAFASEITPNKVIELVNSARQEEGLKPLVKSDVLTKVAQDKLDDMIKNGYFAHTSPSGKNPWTWFAEEGYDYKYAGENLAINFTSAEDQQKAWMKSLTHRKNILNVDYQEIGVAFGAGEIDGKMSLITVQEFGARAVAPEAAENGNNFLFQKGADLLDNGSKILPQVLAIKTKSPDEIGNSSGSNRIDLARTWPGIYSFFLVLADLLLISSLLLLPLSFLAVAFDKIHVLYGTRRQLKKA
jgi:hypothetical protein